MFSTILSIITIILVVISINQVKKYLYVESEIWDLEKDKYYIMLALGDVQDYQLQYHNAKVNLL